MALFIIISAAIAALLFLTKSRKAIVGLCALFYAAQIVFAVAAFAQRGETALGVFTFDNLGIMFHLLMAVVAPVVFYQSIDYLDRESPREFRIYNVSLLLLCLFATGAYYANNSMVTWIFLEATTLATAGLVYHRRTIRSLEAAWKYVFISSVGIAIAYLGILMVSTAVTGEEGLSYQRLAQAVAQANPLYMKLAFLFILTGYSCKMEIFPLYAVGVDANYTAPSPASALISTALVNAGFVAFFRMYKVMTLSDIYPWAKSVLIISGVISLLVAAVYLRRTNNYKRLLSYSTVENSGIAMIGLGIGGAGIFAAVFHMMVHTFVKSGMFLQAAQVGKLYGTYHLNRIGGYFDRYRVGAVAVTAGMICLLAMPPSGLFVSELMIFSEIIAGGRWVLLTIIILLLCLVVYTICRRFSALLLKPVDLTHVAAGRPDRLAAWLHIALFAAAMAVGVMQPGFLTDFINAAL